MGNIVYLVAIIILNSVLKSIKEKQKVEEARKKRISEPQKTMPTNQKNKPISLRDLYRMFNEELEKGLREAKTEPTREHFEQRKDLEKGEGSGFQAKVTESACADFSEEHYSRGGHRDLEEEKRQNNESKIRKKQELKKDIIRGIVFSEILSEPKALRKKYNQ